MADRYCPCNGRCHVEPNPCSFDCVSHHGEMQTYDLGAVHVLVKPNGECRDDCPHPGHAAISSKGAGRA